MIPTNSPRIQRNRLPHRSCGCNTHGIHGIPHKDPISQGSASVVLRHNWDGVSRGKSGWRGKITSRLKWRNIWRRWHHHVNPPHRPSACVIAVFLARSTSASTSRIVQSSCSPYLTRLRSDSCLDLPSRFLTPDIPTAESLAKFARVLITSSPSGGDPATSERNLGGLKIKPERAPCSRTLSFPIATTSYLKRILLSPPRPSESDRCTTLAPTVARRQSRTRPWSNRDNL